MIQTGESLEFIINALIENKKVENSIKPIEDTYKERDNKTPSRVTRRLSNNGFTGKSPLRNPVLRQRTSPSPRHKKKPGRISDVQKAIKQESRKCKTTRIIFKQSIKTKTRKFNKRSKKKI